MGQKKFKNKIPTTFLHSREMCVSVCMSVCLSVCLFVRLSVCLSVCECGISTVRGGNTQADTINIVLFLLSLDFLGLASLWSADSGCVFLIALSLICAKRSNVNSPAASLLSKVTTLSRPSSTSVASTTKKFQAVPRVPTSDSGSYNAPVEG